MLSTIQRKYILSIIMVVMIFLTGLLLFNYYLLRTHSLAQAEKTSLLILNSSDAQLNQIFQEIEALVSSLSQVRTVRKVDVKAMAELFITNVMVRHEYIRALYLGTTSGEMYEWGVGEGFIDHVPTFPPDYDPRVRPWYHRAVEEGGYALTDPYVFASVEALGITAVHPVYDGERFIGVLGLDLVLNGLDYAVNSLTIQRGGKIILLNRNLQILTNQFSPTEKQVMELEIFPYPEMIREEERFTIEEFSGERYLVSSMKNRSTGWIIILFLPYGEIMDFSQQILKIIIAFDILLMLLLGVLITAITRRVITAPLDKIIFVLRQLERGDTNCRIPRLPGREFDLMARLFNRFSDLSEESSRKMENKVRDRTRAVIKLQQENVRLRIIEEKERIYGNLHDSLGARLTNINISNHVAKSAWELDKRQVLREMLERIENNTQQGILDLKEILMAREGDEMIRRDFLSFIAKGVYARLALKEIVVESFLPNEDELSLLDPDILMNCEKILQEIVSNTLKHSQAGKVKLEMEIDFHRVHLRYSDDGDGFHLKEALKNGFGLQGLYSRAERMGGILKINSRPKRGTSFDLQFRTGE